MCFFGNITKPHNVSGQFSRTNRRKNNLILTILCLTLLVFAGCSKNEEAKHVRVQSEPPEVVAETQKKAEQAPSQQEITDADRERMKKELQDPSRFESTDTINKSSEEINADLTNQLDSIGQPSKE